MLIEKDSDGAACPTATMLAACVAASIPAAHSAGDDQATKLDAGMLHGATPRRIELPMPPPATDVNSPDSLSVRTLPRAGHDGMRARAGAVTVVTAVYRGSAILPVLESAGGEKTELTVQLRRPSVMSLRRAACAVDARINAAEEACETSVTMTHVEPVTATHDVSLFVDATTTTNAHSGTALQETAMVSPAAGSAESVTVKGARRPGKDETATLA